VIGRPPDGSRATKSRTRRPVSPADSRCPWSSGHLARSAVAPRS